MAMLGDDKSIDPEGVREELRTEWILLNGALKDIRQNYQEYFDTLYLVFLLLRLGLLQPSLAS